MMPPFLRTIWAKRMNGMPVMVRLPKLKGGTHSTGFLLVRGWQEPPVGVLGVLGGIQRCPAASSSLVRAA